MLHSATRSASPKKSTETPLVLICAVVFLSGIPALIYQTVWQRLLVLHSGVGTTSVATIVTAYLLGLGIGSWMGARLTRKFSAQQAVWLVIGLEIAIGAYAVASPGLLYDLLYWKFGWLYRNFWLAAVLHLATLVIPTLFMGATLPLLTRALLSQRPELAKSLGLVYGSNTLGAGMGALLAPWLFMPYVGIRGTLSLGAVCNLLVAMSIWHFASQSRALSVAATTKARPRRPSPSSNQAISGGSVVPISLALGMTLTFFTGLVAIGLEILWFRIIDVGVKSTAFTFGTVLCVYLVCMGAGSIWAGVWTSRVSQPLTVFLWAQLMVIGSATLVLIGMLALPAEQAEQLPGFGWVYAYWSQGDPANPNLVGLATTLGLYAVFPMVLMGPSAFAMGYSFTMLQLGTQQTGDSAGYRLGMLQTANICGCAMGSLCVGLLLVDYLGTMGAWRSLMLASLIFPVVGWMMTAQKVPMLASGAALLFLTWLLPTNDRLWSRLHGLDGLSAAYIAEDATGVSVLQTKTEKPDIWSLSANGKVQSQLPFGGVHSKLGVLPVTLHPRPQNVAIIGLGSGDTAWAAGCVPELKALRVFEILTSELTVLQQAAASNDLPQLQGFLDDRRFTIDGADARFKLMTSPEEYDIIEADAIRPNGAYAGYLYSEEFFRLCAMRLRPGGFMCSWSPTTGTYATFCKAFPHVVEIDGGSVLIGSRDPIQLDLPAWKQRLQTPDIQQYLGEQVLRECLASIDTAKPADSGRAPPWVNTDLAPFDEFH